MSPGINPYYDSRVKDYYEIHVTLGEDSGEHISGWNHSVIDGDPDLGLGTRHYRTAHRASEAGAYSALNEAERRWPDAQRFKIEHVIYDDRKK